MAGQDMDLRLRYVTGVKLRPTSCTCGGNTAIVVEVDDGVEVMIGCACHTGPGDFLITCLKYGIVRRGFK